MALIDRHFGPFFIILPWLLAASFHVLAANPMHPMQEGKTYKTQIGWHESMAPASFMFKDGVYYLNAKIGFFGVGLFSRTTIKKNKMANPHVKLIESFYGTNKTSFSDIPGAVDLINEVLRKIERYYATDYFRLTLEPIFPDELEFLSKEALAVKNYNVFQSRIFENWSKFAEGLGCLPILISAFPDQTYMKPTIWDLASRPVLLAHEFGHLLGITTEGYMLENYPANGLMNDEYVFTELEKSGIEPSLIVSDFNEFARHLLLIAKPSVSKSELESFFSPNNDGFENASAFNYFDLKEADRAKLAKEKIERFMGCERFKGRTSK